MERKPVDVSLTEAEKYELVKRALKEKEEELSNVERDMRDLMTEDAELEYLSSFIGAEYINPEGKNNVEEITPLQQKREYLAYVVAKLEEKKNELEQGVARGAGSPPPSGQEAASGSPAPPPSGKQDMWGSA
jgi:hypothetical protein